MLPQRDMHTATRRPLATQTAIAITPLADACNRGDVPVAELLLADPRVNPWLGSAEVPLPAQYAIRCDCMPILHLLADTEALVPQHEAALLATAERYNRRHIYDWLRQLFLARKQLSDLPPEEAVLRLWFEFCKHDLDGSGCISKDELRALAAALGTPLTELELAEAQTALDTDGNGKVDFEELVAFWLADEAHPRGINPAVVEATARVLGQAPEPATV